MGGCRCIFRDCTVSTARNPRMHFFRFPLKDEARLQLWVKMANASQILDLPLAQRRNKVVCARHFRDKYFMNYHKDKLNCKAVPTLQRIRKNMALDYEADSNTPVIVELPPCELAHMKAPPEYECPLGLDDNDPELERSLAGEINGDSAADDRPQSEQEVFLSLDDDLMEILQPKSKRRRPRSPSTAVRKSMAALNTKPVILNIEAPSNMLCNIAEPEEVASSFIRKAHVEYLDQQDEPQADFVDEDTPNKPEEELEDFVDYDPPKSDNVKEDEAKDETVISREQYEETCQHYKQLLQAERDKNANMQADMTKQLQEVTAKLEAAQLKLKTDAQQNAQHIAEQLKLNQINEELSQQLTELETKTETLSILNELCKTRMDALTQKHDNVTQQKNQLQLQHQALQQQHQTLQQKHQQQQQQVSTVSTSKDAPQKALVTNNTYATVAAPAASAHQPLSKAQLFNGIKKYLSATMVALVRMEMFGSSERQWKPDEKQAALELVRLGEHVYKYFTDEWRFRLPGMQQVRVWLSESAVLLDDEEDL